MAKYKALIDADGIVYRVGFALEDVNSLSTVEHQVLATIDSYMVELTKVFKSVSKPIIVISPTGQENNFRYKVAKTLPYKGNRTAPKPKHYEYIRKLLSEMEGAIVAEGQEADDTLADIAAEDISKTIIVSQDKDMRQVPGWHLEPSGGDEPKRPVYYVDPDTDGNISLERATGDKASIFATGKFGLYSQMLLGDTSDNIQGLKGYGAVNTYAILKNRDVDGFDLDKIVRECYQNAGAIDRFDEIYTLLKIGGHKHGKNDET